MEDVRSFLRETIKSHRVRVPIKKNIEIKLTRPFSPPSSPLQEKLNENNVHNLTDVLLLEQAKHGTDAKTFSDEQLVTVLSDVFIAGTETTSKSLNWACLFMLTFPEVITMNIVHRYELVLYMYRRRCLLARMKHPDFWRGLSTLIFGEDRAPSF